MRERSSRERVECGNVSAAVRNFMFNEQKLFFAYDPRMPPPGELLNGDEQVADGGYQRFGVHGCND